MAKPTQKKQQGAGPGSRASAKKEAVNKQDQATSAVGEGEVPPRIVIDGVEYDASNLSASAEGALASLRFSDARVMALQSELAVCQTARFAYIKSLKEELAEKNQ
jgi:ribosome assembly protein YihI (activator of Der GTPase)